MGVQTKDKNQPVGGHLVWLGTSNGLTKDQKENISQTESPKSQRLSHPVVLLGKRKRDKDQVDDTIWTDKPKLTEERQKLFFEGDATKTSDKRDTKRQKTGITKEPLHTEELLSEELPKHSLVSAARQGDSKLIRWYIDSGADLNEKICGNTALMYAGFYGHDEVVHLLTKNGAEVDAKNCSGVSALHWAVQNEQPIVVNMLLHRGADVNLKDNMGRSPLHKAARKGNIDIARILIRNGADVNALAGKMLDLSPVLHEAVLSGNVALVRQLIHVGAKVDVENTKGRTPLHRAAYRNSSCIVSALLELGAIVNKLDINARTPLHWAAFFGHTETTEILVKNGAQCLLKDKIGLTPKAIANAKKHYHLVVLLH